MFRKLKQWFGNSHPLDEPKTQAKPRQLFEADVNEMLLAQHGTVTVSNNQLLVTNPDDAGSFATLFIPKDPRLTVKIDDQNCIGRVVLHKDQDIHVSITNTSPLRQFSMEVSEDAMKVVARVEVSPGEEYQLNEVFEARHATLEIVGATKTYPGPLEASAIMAQLQSEGLQGELDNAALETICHAIGTREIILLRGKPPVQGSPASFKQVPLQKIYDQLHRRMRVSTVPIGTTVAVLEPEVPGTPGRDVYGNDIPVPQHRPLPTLGNGVTEVNGRVVAVRSGRLVFTKRLIDVVPELVIHHDLSNKDGKVEFDGNVVILGNVLDGSFIRATGSVEVHGGVLCSTVMGEGGVFISRAIVGSEVVAGQSKLLYTKLHPVLKQCLEKFDAFQSEYVQLVRHVMSQSGQHTRLPILADVLLNQRHGHLDRLFAILSEDSDNTAAIDEHYHQAVQLIRTKWSGAGRTNISGSDVELFRNLLENYATFIECAMSSDLATIKAASVTSSPVRSSGKIIITGAGVYASSIESGDSIVIRGTTRGGFLVAQNLVRINELGTSSGTETSVKVTNRSGKIVIRTRHPNTLLQVGTSRDRNQMAEYNTIFRGNRDANPNPSRRRLA